MTKHEDENTFIDEIETMLDEADKVAESESRLEHEDVLRKAREIITNKSSN